MLVQVALAAAVAPVVTVLVAQVARQVLVAQAAQQPQLLVQADQAEQRPR
jgi:hypothetical protein